MKKTTNFTVQFRRKREGRTNYKKRLALLKSDKTRVVIRKSLTSISVQFINYETKGDKIIAGVNSKELKKLGWNISTKNTPGSYLTGYLAGKKVQKAKVKEAILDAGLSTPILGSNIYAAVKGIVDSGVHIPVSKEAFPKDDRIKGTHIEKHKKIQISKLFEETKSKIDKM